MTEESKRVNSKEAAVLADQAWLRALARRLIGDPALADDACQEAWLSQRVQAADGAQRRRLLLGAMRRFAWRWRRSESRRRRREAAVARVESLPATAELLHRGEQRELLWRRVTELDEPFRTTLLLRYQEDLSAQEIARRGGLREDTVRWRLRRGLELLRARYASDAGGGRASLLMVATSLSGLESAPVGVGLTVGALTMKKLAAAGLVLALIWMTAAFLPAEWETEEPVAMPSGEFGIVDRDPVADQEERGRRSSVPVLASGADSLTAGRVLGQIVDDVGLGLGGVRVRLIADAGRGAAASLWSREVRTAADGTFVIDAAQRQGLARLQLIVDPPAMFSGASRAFGLEQGAHYGPLNGHTVDVGAIRLAPAGAARGRLIDEAGVPIGGIRLGSGELGTTATSGAFELHHLEIGPRTLRLSASGYLVREVELTIERGVMTELGDLALQVAPRVQGRVIDSDGRPLAHANVSTRGYTRGWRFDVGADGRFDVPVPTTGTGSIRARADGYRGSRSQRIAAGDRDIEIRLEPSPERGVFRVVDGATGSPVERFAMKVVEAPDAGVDLGFLSYDVPGSYHRDGGIARAACRIGSSLLVAGLGYRAVTVEVTADAFADRGQMVQLVSAPHVRGRLVDESGRPVAGGGSVGLRLGALARTIDDGTARPVPFGEDGWEKEFDDGLTAHGGHALNRWRAVGDSVALPPVSLDELSERRRANVDDDGRFRFDGLGRGAFELSASFADGRVLERRLVRMPDHGDLDLGDVRLVAPGTCSGRLESGPVELAGATVRLNSRYSRATPVTADGRFDLGSLAPGLHHLVVDLGDHGATLPDGFVFEVRSGQHRDLAIPLNLAAQCRLKLEVRLNGEAPGTAMMFVEPQSADGINHSVELSDGRGEVTVPAGVDVDFAIYVGGCRVEVARIVLPAGPAQRQFDVATAGLEVVLPNGFVWSEAARYRLKPNVGRPLHLDADEHLVRGPGGDWAVRLASVDPAITTLQLEIQRDAYVSGWEGVAAAPVELRAGASTSVRLIGR